MKKAIMYIVLLLVVSIITISGTYAFFTANAELNVVKGAKTHQLLVKYSGDIAISGELELSKTKEEGYRRVLSISLDEKSLAAKAHIFLRVDEITEGFQNEALKWEIYELINGKEQYVNSGTFLNQNSNSTTYLVENLILSTSTRTFVVYLWLNGYEAGNEVIGAKLIGYFGAETETISGELSK